MSEVGGASVVVGGVSVTSGVGGVSVRVGGCAGGGEGGCVGGGEGGFGGSMPSFFITTSLIRAVCACDIVGYYIIDLCDTCRCVYI